MPARRLPAPRMPLLVLLLCLVLGGCVAPAFDSGAYTQNAIAALESAVSVNRTAALALRARLDDRATRAYADTVVTGSEEAIAPLEASFGDVDPSSRDDDELHASVMALLGDTSDALAVARIAVRRDDRSGMRSSVEELTRLGDRLEAAAESLS